MFDPFAVIVKHFDRFLIVVVKMIAQCFPANGTRNDFVAVHSTEQDDLPTRIVPPAGTEKTQRALVHHAEDLEDGRDARKLNILLTVLEAGNGRRAHPGQRGETLLR